MGNLKTKLQDGENLEYVKYIVLTVIQNTRLAKPEEFWILFKQHKAR